MKKLLKAGLIEKNKVGKEYKYNLKIELDMCIFLVKYKDALSDESINLFLSWHPQLVNDETDELAGRIFKTVLEIFPHPYHI